MIARVLLPFLCLAAVAVAAPTREDVLRQTLAPYAGLVERGTDVSTLTGKVVCGYQGWFACEGDGSERGWVHWSKSRRQFGPGTAKIDLWPDVSELAPDELFDTGFRHADGRTARVFSSHKKATVLRHFRWMKDHGLDGVMVQRFAVDLRDPRGLRHNNTVLAHCREGANSTGRGWALMYDLSGLPAGGTAEVLADWRLLREKMRLGQDAAYFHHRKRPLVAVWGIGFSDKRAYSLAECRQLVGALRADGAAVMVGVPTYWRELKNDALADAELHRIVQQADIVSPWTVGRYDSPENARRHADRIARPDMEWCRTRGVDYLPVVFPGFSWHNMHGGALGAIPRRQGDFFWSQVLAAKSAGATMLYVAMFDECDEGTAVFKCTDDPPSAPDTPFLTLEGLPSDYYLRLTGAAGRVIRGEAPPEAPKPTP